MFQLRVQKLRNKLRKEKLDAVLISSVSNITYLTGYSNFFKEERDGYVLITKNGNYILTHSIYSQSLKNKIPNFEVIEISRREPPEKVLQNILGKSTASIGIEEHDLRVYEYKRINKIFKNLKNFDLKIKRSIKDKDEIELIARACKVGDEVFKKVLKKIKLGISEKQLVFEIESLIKKENLDVSFRTIVAFGANASAPHHQSGKSKLKKDQFIVMDFGVIFENYCSDMTRTIFFGKPSAKQRKIYETVLEAQKRAIQLINSGKKIKAKEVDRVAREYIKSKGFPDIPHSLGHGIGLEVHEHPYLSNKSKEELKEGMVFSIEPGIYLENLGGVRIEDLFVLENRGLKQITNASKELMIF
ncbi:aminopeptidase P family protein [Candidatus Daviesbacteria bacterium]|nr:aminopeptidase P family protein [Candidatus Daviesbacteria bacterium]